VLAQDPASAATAPRSSWSTSTGGRLRRRWLSPRTYRRAQSPAG